VRGTRRAALRAAAGGAAWLLLGGHAPYGQWGVYRKRHLLVLTTRADPHADDLGARVAAALAERLPDSKAEVSRAPHRERVASLISSRQMDVALMRRDEAAALRQGARPFADYGPVALHAIVAVGDYLLVCRDDFPARHAWRIAEALARDPLLEVRSPVPATAGPRDAVVPPHDGARTYFAGQPLPDAHSGPEPGDEHAHDLTAHP
jgi:hypothetical protein